MKSELKPTQTKKQNPLSTCYLAWRGGGGGSRHNGDADQQRRATFTVRSIDTKKRHECKYYKHQTQNRNHPPQKKKKTRQKRHKKNITNNHNHHEQNKTLFNTYHKHELHDMKKEEGFSCRN